jgi:hypothetical protein
VALVEKRPVDHHDYASRSTAAVKTRGVDTAEATTQARIAKLTPAQRAALARKAGKASGAVRREKKEERSQGTTS